MADTVNLVQTRGHSGHSHGHGLGHHHHHHDSTFLTSSNKNDPGVKITRVGLFVNLGMAIAKGAGGYVFNSQALAADAMHSLTDLISDITTLATISYSVRQPTPRFPTGYGKIESLGALGVSSILLSGGIMIGLQAVTAIAQQFFPDMAHILHDLGILGHGHGHSHSHGAEDFGPNINAAWLAGGSILIKEWLYRATMKVAKEKRSSVLASNAYHHRVDSLTAIVALATICASHFFTNAAWLDPVGGLLISGMIVQAGYGNVKAALLELADVCVDEETQSSVKTATLDALSEVDGSFSAEQILVQGIKSGQNFLIEVAINVPDTWTVRQTKTVEDKVRQAISDNVNGAKRVTVRFATLEAGDSAFAQEFVAPKPEKLEENGHGGHDHEHHDHSHDHAHSHDSETASAKRK